LALGSFSLIRSRCSSKGICENAPLVTSLLYIKWRYTRTQTRFKSAKSLNFATLAFRSSKTVPRTDFLPRVACFGTCRFRLRYPRAAIVYACGVSDGRRTNFWRYDCNSSPSREDLRVGLPIAPPCRTSPYLVRERSYGPPKWPNGRLWPVAAPKPSPVWPFGPRRTRFGTSRFRPCDRRGAISDGRGATARFSPARGTVARLRGTVRPDQPMTPMTSLRPYDRRFARSVDFRRFARSGRVSGWGWYWCVATFKRWSLYSNTVFAIRLISILSHFWSFSQFSIFVRVACSNWSRDKLGDQVILKWSQNPAILLKCTYLR